MWALMQKKRQKGKRKKGTVRKVCWFEKVTLVTCTRADAESGTALKRSLSVWDLIAYGLASTLGTGMILWYCARFFTHSLLCTPRNSCYCWPSCSSNNWSSYCVLFCFCGYDPCTKLAFKSVVWSSSPKALHPFCQHSAIQNLPLEYQVQYCCVGC
jgi:hypothetical protein